MKAEPLQNTISFVCAQCPRAHVLFRGKPETLICLRALAVAFEIKAKTQRTQKNEGDIKDKSGIACAEKQLLPAGAPAYRSRPPRARSPCRSRNAAQSRICGGRDTTGRARAADCAAGAAAPAGHNRGCAAPPR